MPFKWGGDPNYLLNGMILQAGGDNPKIALWNFGWMPCKYLKFPSGVHGKNEMLPFNGCFTHLYIWPMARGYNLFHPICNGYYVLIF